MKKYMTVTIIFTALFFSCKTQEKTIEIEDITPGRDYTAVVGDVISFNESVLLLKVEKSKQGGASAPKILPKETKFIITKGYKRYHSQKHGESIEKYLKSGKTIGFTCIINHETKEIEVSQIIKP